MKLVRLSGGVFAFVCFTCTACEFTDYRLASDKGASDGAFADGGASGADPASGDSTTKSGGRSSGSEFRADAPGGENPKETARRDAGTPNPVPAVAGFDRGWSLWPVSGAFPADDLDASGDTIADRATDLVWDKAPLPVKLAQDEAEAGCRASRVGGYTDWRVPTRIELLSLVDHQRTPATRVPFAAPLDGTFWTSTRYVPEPSRGWQVAFDRGQARAASISDTLSVRCVREGRVYANDAAHRFVKTAGGVLDKETKLTWETQMQFSGVYAKAIAYCSTLVVDGTGGFRLPTIHELASVVNDQRKSPALEPGFTTKGLTWSATRATTGGGVLWTIDEYDGHSLRYDESGVAGARCVRP